MSALEVGLVVALALLAVVAAAQARALTAAGKRLELLERRFDRRERRTDRSADATTGSEAVPAEAPDETAHHRPTEHEAPAAPATPATRADEPEGDAVDIRGADAEGEPTTIPLEETTQPTVLAFLSTTCGICVGLWERLRVGELGEAVPGVVPVVVTKDAGLEDVSRIRELASADLPVVLSSEAWDDYEVPGSPYVMVISAAPGSVVTEGSVATWDDLVRMAGSVAGTGSSAR